MCVVAVVVAVAVVVVGGAANLSIFHRVGRVTGTTLFFGLRKNICFSTVLGVI